VTLGRGAGRLEDRLRQVLELERSIVCRLTAASDQQQRATKPMHARTILQRSRETPAVGRKADETV
jgi:hypothetical protein